MKKTKQTDRQKISKHNQSVSWDIYTELRYTTSGGERRGCDIVGGTGVVVELHASVLHGRRAHESAEWRRTSKGGAS